MNRILVVIDMQNDFITGSLGTKEAEAIVSNVADKIRSYREKHFRVFATKDTHYSDTYLTTQEGKKLPVLHCIKDTDGWRFPEELEELISPTEIWNKESFGSLRAMEAIAQVAKKTNAVVEFCGLCTDICVIENVALLKTIDPELEIEVDSSCCAGVTPEKHNAALEIMRSLQVKVF